MKTYGYVYVDKNYLIKEEYYIDNTDQTLSSAFNKAFQVLGMEGFHLKFADLNAGIYIFENVFEINK